MEGDRAQIGFMDRSTQPGTKSIVVPKMIKMYKKMFFVEKIVFEWYYKRVNNFWCNTRYLVKDWKIIVFDELGRVLHNNRNTESN